MKSIRTMLALGAAMMFLTQCATTDEQVPRSYGTSGVIDEVLTSSDPIQDNPGRYVGKTVLLSGEVEDLVGPRAFLMDTDGMFGFSEILVFNATGRNVPVVEGRDAEVVGPVRLLYIADIEKEIDYDLADEAYSEWVDKPVIVAEKIVQY